MRYVTFETVRLFLPTRETEYFQQKEISIPMEIILKMEVFLEFAYL